MAKKLNIGVVGAGRIGKVHCEALCLRVADAQVRAVTDPDRKEAEKLAERFGIPRVSENFEDLLAVEELEAVVICSPTDTHAAYVQAAARSGKHIFCEKPLDHDPVVIRSLISEASENGVNLMVGYNRRFDPDFRKAREMVKSGAVGDIHILRVTSRDPAPPPLEYIKVSGGIFLDMSIHDFDMARFITGAEVVEVFSRGEVLVDERIGGAGDIDTAVTTLKFDSGAIGVIDNSRRAVYGYDQRLEVFGSEGMVRVENKDHHNCWIYNASGTQGALPLDFFMDRYRDAYTLEMKAFIDTVNSNTRPPVDGEDGLKSVLIGLAAKKSLLENRPVRIDEIQTTVSIRD